MAINSNNYDHPYQRDGFDKVLKALDVATTVYGIKHNIDVNSYQDAQRQNEMQAQQQRNDPNSNESKLAQKQQDLYLGLASQNGADEGTISALRNSIYGTPGGKALGPVNEQGIGPKDVVAVPGMSAAALDRNPIAASLLQNFVKNTANQNKLTIDLGKNDLTGQKIEAGKQIADANNQTKSDIAAGKNDTSLAVADKRNQGSPAIDKLVIATGNNYDRNMKDFVNLQDNIKKIESTFNTKDENGKSRITSKQLGEANAAVAAIYSPNHMSDATVHRTEYESTQADIANAWQKLTANPTDIGSRALIDHIIDQAHYLGNVSNQNALQHLNDMDSTYEATSNPKIREAAQKKHDHYIQRFSNIYPTIGNKSQQSQPQQSLQPQGVVPISSSQDQQYTPDVIDYAKNNGMTPDQANQLKIKRMGK